MKLIEILEKIKIMPGNDDDFPETLDIIKSIESQIFMRGEKL